MRKNCAIKSQDGFWSILIQISLPLLYGGIISLYAKSVVWRLTHRLQPGSYQMDGNPDVFSEENLNPMPLWEETEAPRGLWLLLQVSDLYIFTLILCSTTFSSPISFILNQTVSDKESRMKETLSILGLTKVPYMFSHFITCGL